MKAKKRSLVVIGAMLLALVACSASAPYYQVNRFASMDGSNIVNELEKDQNLEYEERTTKSVDYLWTGVPKGVVEPNDGVVVHFKGGDDGRDLSRDDLLANASIDKVSVYWSGNKLENWSDAKSRVDAIMKKCGFKEQLKEELDDMFGAWYRIGKCKLGGKDAYWGIAIYKDGNVYVAARTLGDKTYEELADRGINTPALM